MALEPIEDNVPEIIKKISFQIDTSHAILFVLSNLVAASIDVTAVITRTITILGFDTSI